MSPSSELLTCGNSSPSFCSPGATHCSPRHPSYFLFLFFPSPWGPNFAKSLSVHAGQGGGPGAPRSASASPLGIPCRGLVPVHRFLTLILDVFPWRIAALSDRSRPGRLMSTRDSPLSARSLTLLTSLLRMGESVSQARERGRSPWNRCRSGACLVGLSGVAWVFVSWFRRGRLRFAGALGSGLSPALTRPASAGAAFVRRHTLSSVTRRKYPPRLAHLVAH